MGASDGAFWSSLPLAVGKVFGRVHEGAIFGSVILIGATGVIALSLGVQPAVYAAHGTVRIQGNSSSVATTMVCVGMDCFLLTSWIFAGCTVAGTGAAALALRIARAGAGIRYQHLHAMEVEADEKRERE